MRHTRTVWRRDMKTRALVWHASNTRTYRITASDGAVDAVALGVVDVTPAGFMLVGLGVHASLGLAIQKALELEGHATQPQPQGAVIQ